MGGALGVAHTQNRVAADLCRVKGWEGELTVDVSRQKEVGFTNQMLWVSRYENLGAEGWGPKVR